MSDERDADQEAEVSPILPQRSRPAHLPAHTPVNRTIIQFVTVCTQDRRPILDNSNFHDQLVALWRTHTRFHVGHYVILPDHLHLFCSPSRWPPDPLGPWMRFWKTFVAKHSSIPGKLWQRGYWDTQLRSHESYAEKWNYIRNNPVRAGLVQAPDDWPYQGEVFPLRWHD